MMVERHYDEEALIGLLEKQSLHSDPHLSSCADCSERLHSFRTITSILHEHDVWDRTQIRRDPIPETIASLRAFADRMAAEDTAADAILPKLLAGPREEWMPRLMAHPEWRTAGVVRRLVGAAYGATSTHPLDGLEISGLCTEIADHLDSPVPADTVARLRGAAWRERAFALFYVGRFTDALAAADRADSAFRTCVVDEFDRARVAIIRTLALRPQENFAAAMAAAQFSAETFERFDDAEHVVSARLAEMQLLFSRGDYEGAIAILTPLERRLRSSDDAENHARVLNNLGSCLWKLGRLEEALRHHETAAMIIDTLGMAAEASRTRWNIALILAQAGRVDEARTRLESLREKFTSFGMTSEAALVRLDLAELLLACSAFDQIDAICREAIQSFEAAGLAYTSRALTALAYMREAAQRRTVTPVLVKHVREYIRRLPQDGQLLFAPPRPESA